MHWIRKRSLFYNIRIELKFFEFSKELVRVLYLKNMSLIERKLVITYFLSSNASEIDLTNNAMNLVLENSELLQF